DSFSGDRPLQSKRIGPIVRCLCARSTRMGYRAMQFECHCGEPPDRILEIGLTSDAKIVVHFWCSACQRVFYMSQALDECRQECPPPDAEADALSAAGDAHFLRSIGIAVSE